MICSLCIKFKSGKTKRTFLQKRSGSKLAKTKRSKIDKRTVQKAPKKTYFFGAFLLLVFWLSHQKSLTLNNKEYIIFGF